MMSLTFGLFTQVSGSGPLGPLVSLKTEALKDLWHTYDINDANRKPSIQLADA